MLVLMSMVLVCLVADEDLDAQQLAKQTVSSACMSVIGDDFDLDEDDDDDIVTTSFDEAKDWTSISMLEACGQKTERSKCSMALLRGQVRRYSPRNNLSDSHNYTLLSIMKSGVDLFHAIFFMQFTQLLIKSLISNEKTAFFNLAHGHCI